MFVAARIEGRLNSLVHENVKKFSLGELLNFHYTIFDGRIMGFEIRRILSTTNICELFSVPMDASNLTTQDHPSLHGTLAFK